MNSLNKEIEGLRLEVKSLRSQPQDGVVSSSVNGGRVSIKSDLVLGDKAAKVAIVEFSDFQCPYCKRFAESAFREIKRDYIDTGKVKYIMRDFPLGFHAQAKQAAVASRCASAQGALLEMRGALFDGGRNLNEYYFKNMAKKLELNEGKFSRCLADKLVLAKVEEDYDHGVAIGVTGTPRFFVGRVSGEDIVDVKTLSGAKSFTSFKRTLEPLFVSNK
ncbi:hypothetical protein A9Q81_24390 [Gammaproteobacteria bacterium 42_54_T18]|nr:hypothetical protein A9Q81_24390 [Gammaproteobacteria bacterium 42_54_T18]